MIYLFSRGTMLHYYVLLWSLRTFASEIASSSPFHRLSLLSKVYLNYRATALSTYNYFTPINIPSRISSTTCKHFVYTTVLPPSLSLSLPLRFLIYSSQRGCLPFSLSFSLAFHSPSAENFRLRVCSNVAERRRRTLKTS